MFTTSVLTISTFLSSAICVSSLFFPFFSFFFCYLCGVFIYFVSALIFTLKGLPLGLISFSFNVCIYIVLPCLTIVIFSSFILAGIILHLERKKTIVEIY